MVNYSQTPIFGKEEKDIMGRTISIINLLEKDIVVPHNNVKVRMKERKKTP